MPISNSEAEQQLSNDQEYQLQSDSVNLRFTGDSTGFRSIQEPRLVSLELEEPIDMEVSQTRLGLYERQDLEVFNGVTFSELPLVGDLEPYLEDLNDLGEFGLGDTNRQGNAAYIFRLLSAKMQSFDMQSGRDKVYLPALNHVKSQLMSPQVSDDEKRTLLFKLAEAVGNCNTPAKDFFIRQNLLMPESALKVSKQELKLLSQKVELEGKVKVALQLAGCPVNGVEAIENMAGLFLGMYTSPYQNSEFNSHLPIMGGPVFPITLSAAPNYAFAKVTPEQAQVFLKMVCRTKPDGSLIQHDGKYLYDATKVARLTPSTQEAFRHVELASQQRETFNFKAQYGSLSQNPKYQDVVSLYYDIVPDILNYDQQREVFYDNLEMEGLVDSNEREQYFNQYFEAYLIPLFQYAYLKGKAESEGKEVSGIVPPVMPRFNPSKIAPSVESQLANLPDFGDIESVSLNSHRFSRITPYRGGRSRMNRASVHTSLANVVSRRRRGTRRLLDAMTSSRQVRQRVGDSETSSQDPIPVLSNSHGDVTLEGMDVASQNSMEEQGAENTSQDVIPVLSTNMPSVLQVGEGDTQHQDFLRNMQTTIVVRNDSSLRPSRISPPSSPPATSINRRRRNSGS